MGYDVYQRVIYGFKTKKSNLIKKVNKYVGNPGDENNQFDPSTGEKNYKEMDYYVDDTVLSWENKIFGKFFIEFDVYESDTNFCYVGIPLVSDGDGETELYIGPEALNFQLNRANLIEAFRGFDWFDEDSIGFYCYIQHSY